MRIINKEDIVQIRLPFRSSDETPVFLCVNNVYKAKKQKNDWAYRERNSNPQCNSPVSMFYSKTNDYIKKTC